ncbi:unnamed protein product [Phytophthora lilii]|uniref:Unnamed protein product n=1 Tax=Phytophthora lilii TaxID=2077276 RepID=A0A9W6U3Q0_9STRA|nr:unnamed protein product [Phytophthora lilii]
MHTLCSLIKTLRSRAQVDARGAVHVHERDGHHEDGEERVVLVEVLELDAAADLERGRHKVHEDLEHELQRGDASVSPAAAGTAAAAAAAVLSWYFGCDPKKKRIPYEQPIAMYSAYMSAYASAACSDRSRWTRSWIGSIIRSEDVVRD